MCQTFDISQLWSMQCKVSLLVSPMFSCASSPVTVVFLSSATFLSCEHFKGDFFPQFHAQNQSVHSGGDKRHNCSVSYFLLFFGATSQIELRGAAIKFRAVVQKREKGVVPPVGLLISSLLASLFTLLTPKLCIKVQKCKLGRT